MLCTYVVRVSARSVPRQWYPVHFDTACFDAPLDVPLARLVFFDFHARFSSSSYDRTTQRTLWKACVNCIYKARSSADHGFGFGSGIHGFRSRSLANRIVRSNLYEIHLLP